MGMKKPAGVRSSTIDLQAAGYAVGKVSNPAYSSHARIIGMDTGKAESVSGSPGVLRMDDPELPEMANLGGHVPNLVTVCPASPISRERRSGAMQRRAGYGKRR